jgi:hypothetical protein
MLVFTALAALAVATACSDEPASGVATAGGGTAEDGGGEAPADLTQEEAMLAFSQCMRDNGIEDFPDVGGGGRGVRLGPEIAEDPDFEPAMETCREMLPDGAGQGGRSDFDEETALAFAQCMRENGVEDFPDPTEHGMAITRDMVNHPDWEEATEACSDIIEVGFGGQG